MRQTACLRQGGVSMVEFVIVALLFLVFIFATIDVARFLYTEAILDKAAQRVLNYAQKAQGLDKDSREFDIGSDEHTLIVQSYNTAIGLGQQILSAGPLVPSSGADGGPKPWLASYSMTMPFANGSEAVAADIILLRPGDSALIQRSNGTSEWVDHPDYCSESAARQAAAPACTTLPADYDYAKILEEYPVQVEIQAAFSPIIPLLPFNITAGGRAIGFREFVSETSVPHSDIPMVTLTTTTTTTTTSSSVPTTAGTGGPGATNPPHIPSPPVGGPPGHGGGGSGGSYPGGN